MTYFNLNYCTFIEIKVTIIMYIYLCKKVKEICGLLQMEMVKKYEKIICVGGGVGEGVCEKIV